MTNILRNGDWFMVKVDSSELKGELLKHEGEFVFAEGEATNHFHAIKVKDKEDLKIVRLPDGSYVFQLKKDGVATHPEHSIKTDLKIKKGTYKLTQKREKDWFQLVTRKVID